MKTSKWQTYLQTHSERFIQEMQDFLRIPSISALPAHAADVAAAGRWVARRLERAGLENAQVMPTGGHPVVYADWLHAPGKPTVLIYGHFDVQPVDPIDLWTHPPFEPVIENNCLYARGASDDKGNLMAPITALEALLDTEGRLPLNIKFFAEGQEEIGSPQLPKFLQENKSLLGCDLVVSADGLQWSPDQPKIDLAYKGMVALEIEVQGSVADLHSGLYGGMIQNPNHALASILASFHDASGRVTVKGFYDGVVPPTTAEREQMARVPFDEAGLMARLQVDTLFGEPGYTPVERGWARPTLEICGMGGGFQGEGIKGIVPARAGAKISCRLTANQDPANIIHLIRRHVDTLSLPGVKVIISPREGGVGPYHMPFDHPGVQAVAGVLTDLYGKSPYITRCGGSIPVCTLFIDSLGVYTVGFSFSLEDENLHGPDEYFRLESFERGQVGYVRLLHALANAL